MGGPNLIAKMLSLLPEPSCDEVTAKLVSWATLTESSIVTSPSLELTEILETNTVFDEELWRNLIKRLAADERPLCSEAMVRGLQRRIVARGEHIAAVLRELEIQADGVFSVPEKYAAWTEDSVFVEQLKEALLSLPDIHTLMLPFGEHWICWSIGERIDFCAKARHEPQLAPYCYEGSDLPRREFIILKGVAGLPRSLGPTFVQALNRC
jgi:hypothetical protein